MKEFLVKFFYFFMWMQGKLLCILGRMIKFVFQNMSFKPGVRFVTIVLVFVCMFKLSKGNNIEYSSPQKAAVQTETKQPEKPVGWQINGLPLSTIPPSSEENTRPYVQPMVVESFPVRVYLLNKGAVNIVTSFKTNGGLVKNEVVAPGKLVVKIVTLVGNDDVSFGIRSIRDKRPPVYHKIGRYPRVAYVFYGENQLLKTTPEKVPEIASTQKKKEEAPVKSITVAEMYKDMARKTARR